MVKLNIQKIFENNKKKAQKRLAVSLQGVRAEEVDPEAGQPATKRYLPINHVTSLVLGVGYYSRYISKSLCDF